MAVKWQLGQPQGGGMLDALKAYQLGSSMRQQQAQVQREEQQFQRAEQQRADLQRAYNPQTGRLDRQAATQAYADAGDFDGLVAYRKTLQGEQAEQAKLIGSLAKGATDQATWSAGLQRAVQLGAITPEEAQQYGEFSPETRRLAMALGGIDEDKPDGPNYRVIPEGGALVNLDDPAAIAEYQRGLSAQPRQAKRVGGKSYYQDANGDWYEGDAGSDAGGSF